MDIPSELEAELTAALQPVLDKALALGRPTHSTAEILDSFQRCITAIVAPVLRRHNSSHVSIYRLPDEILCAIWDLLPLGDRIVAARVCSCWRNLATRIRHIWTELDVCALFHHDSCNCRACRACRTYDPDTDDIDQIPVPALFELILSRSGELPLNIRIDFTAYDPQWVRIWQITQCLQPHLHRLHALSLIVVWSGDLSTFFTHNLNSPGDLVHLRTLVCTANHHTDDAVLTLPDLPNAETFTVQCPYLPLKCDNLHIPSVRRLYCGTIDQTEILSVLDASPSPNLEWLTLDLERFSNRPLDDAKSALIRDKISRLQEMVVLNSDRLTDGIVASMFHVPAVPTLVLPSCSKPAFAIFQDVRDDVHLHIAHTGSEFDPTVTVTATDSGRTRSLSVYWFHGTGSDGTLGPRYIKLQLYCHLSHSSITSLTLPSDIWPYLLRDTSLFPFVRRATVTFNTDTAVLDPLADHQAPLPALEILQLDAHPLLLSVSMKDVAPYIMVLKGAGTRLNRLILRGFVLVGDDDSDEELAKVVDDISNSSM